MEALSELLGWGKTDFKKQNMYFGHLELFLFLMWVWKFFLVNSNEFVTFIKIYLPIYCQAFKGREGRKR